MRLIGFPLADSADYVAPEVAQQTEDLCNSFGDERPLVFAPGTAHEHAGDFLQSAAQACERLKRPGVLISTNAAQIPSRLPPRVVAARYLPFSHLLPRSAAIVHHGGVGTTSQALRAGTPQVVVPMAFDQFDNAERVARLGCGSWLPMHRQNANRLLAHLQELPRSATRTAEVAQQLRQQPSAAVLATELIEALMRAQG